jgi:membrane protease YdiL (CAAX protease family)
VRRADVLQRILGPHRFTTRSPWGAWAGISALIGISLFSMVLTLALIFAGSLFEAGFSAHVFSCMAHAPSGVDAGCSLWLLGMSGLWGIVLAGSIYAVSHMRAGGSPQNVLLLNPSRLSWLQYGGALVAMLAILYALEFGISLAVGTSQGDLDRGLDHIRALAGGGGLLPWVVLIFVVAVVAPVSEEFAFRGFLFTALVKTRIGFFGAAVVTSAAWTVLHYAYAWEILLVLFVFGCLLAYMVWRTGSIWTGIVVHGVNNLISACVLALR